MNGTGKYPFRSMVWAVAAMLAGILLALGLTACSGQEETEPAVPLAQASRVQTTVTVVVPTAPVATVTVESTPAAAEEAATAPDPAASATPALPEDGSLETASLLPGVIYRTEDAMYQIDRSGEPLPLSTNSEITLSPSGDRGLYLADGEVWVVELDTGEERNVTAGSGRSHVSAQWWPARPQTLILGSWGEGEQGPNNGKLTLVEVDGSNYRVAHPEGTLSFSDPAPGPDGQTVAYDEAGTPWLYRVDEGNAQPFTPATYLPRDVEAARGASPAWSPDGRRLAWMMGLTGPGYGEGQAWDGALVIFDLDKLTGTIIHPFAPAGRGGWFPPPQWSPDGEWLIFTVGSQDTEESGLWATAADGSSQRRLHPVGDAPAFWSPPGTEPWQNGAYLLLSEPENTPTAGSWLIARETWGQMPVTRPEGATFVDWRNLEAE